MQLPRSESEKKQQKQTGSHDSLSLTPPLRHISLQTNTCADACNDTMMFQNWPFIVYSDWPIGPNLSNKMIGPKAVEDSSA